MSYKVVSTSYVYHLHSHPSAPPSVKHSRANSSEYLPRSRSPIPFSQLPTEATPLIPDAITTTTLTPSPTPLPRTWSDPSSFTMRNGQGRSQSFSYGSTALFTPVHPILEGHHRYESRVDHISHHSRGLRKDTDWDQVASRHPGEIESAPVHGGDGGSTNEEVKIGRRREIIGILVCFLFCAILPCPCLH
jgi:hypothetical protein